MVASTASKSGVRVAISPLMFSQQLLCLELHRIQGIGDRLETGSIRIFSSPKFAERNKSWEVRVLRSPSVPQCFPIHPRHFPLETPTPSLQKDGERKATGKLGLGNILKRRERKSHDPVFSYRQEIQRSLIVQSSKLWVIGEISFQMSYQYRKKTNGMLDIGRMAG